jgi:hypothetical protein
MTTKAMKTPVSRAEKKRRSRLGDKEAGAALISLWVVCELGVLKGDSWGEMKASENVCSTGGV